MLAAADLDFSDGAAQRSDFRRQPLPRAERVVAGMNALLHTLVTEHAHYARDLRMRRIVAAVIRSRPARLPITGRTQAVLARHGHRSQHAVQVERPDAGE